MGAEVIMVFNIPFIQATWGTVVILWALSFIQSVCKGMYGSYLLWISDRID